MGGENFIDDTTMWSYKYCPRALMYELNWENNIVRDYQWIRDMKGVPQNPVYHAERDVLEHTKLVCEKLISLNEWKQLTLTEQSLVFMAALFHDVAKPKCTIKEDGVIKSPGHSRRGELLSRSILYRTKTPEESIPFVHRESLVKLVRFHGLPIWLMEKASPEMHIYLASQMCKLNLLSLLSKADALGRICADKDSLLYKIEWFNEFCKEHQCLDKPKTFPDSFSRFNYFKKENSYVERKVYDDAKFEVTLMSGLPASGKDTWIKTNCTGIPVISLDDIRHCLNISPQDNQSAVIEEAKLQAKKHMREKRTFVWNATNTTKSTRDKLTRLFISYGGKVRIVYIETPYQMLLRRNANRKNPVPQKVIENLIDKLEIPDITEGHEVFWIPNDK